MPQFVFPLDVTVVIGEPKPKATDDWSGLALSIEKVAVEDEKKTACNASTPSINMKPRSVSLSALKKPFINDVAHFT